MSWAFVPPAAAFKVAAVLGVPIIAGAALAGWLAGGVAAVGLVIGVVGGLALAITDLSWGTRSLLGLLLPVAAWLGVGAAGHPVWAAVLVAAAMLLQWPVGVRYGGVLAFLPVVAALAASVGVSGAERFGGWTSAGVALIFVLAAVLKVRTPVALVPAALARRHAVVAALATGIALWACLENGVTHGYWLVVTLAVVLRPIPGETSSSARDRTLGTVVGAALAIAAVVLLPLPLVAAFLLGCLVLTLAWAVARDLFRQTLFSTPLVVLLGSSGVAGSAVGIAVERLAFTLGAAVVAVGLAALLHRWDRQARS